MPSQIEQRYGVPLPIDALWRELEQRYDAEVIAELQGIYRKATKRYSRAANLNKWRRLISRVDRGDFGLTAARARDILASGPG